MVMRADSITVLIVTVLVMVYVLKKFGQILAFFYGWRSEIEDMMDK